MSNLFANTEPPQWLERIAKPIDAQDVGTRIGAGISSFRKGTSFQDEYAQAKDPLYDLKKLQLTTHIMGIGAQIQSQKLTYQLKQQMIGDEADDQSNMADITMKFRDKPDELLQAVSSRNWKSTKGRLGASTMIQGLNDLVRERSKGLQVTSFNKTISDLQKNGVDVSDYILPDADGKPPVLTAESYRALQLKHSEMVKKQKDIQPKGISIQMPDGSKIPATYNPATGSYHEVKDTSAMAAKKAEESALLREHKAKELGSRKQVSQLKTNERQLAGARAAYDAATLGKDDAEIKKWSVEGARLKAERALMLNDVIQEKDPLTGSGFDAGGQNASAPAQATPKTKVALANELSAKNPSWTREQVISEVNKQFK